MTVPVPENQQQEQNPNKIDEQINWKRLNAKHEREIQQEREARLAAEAKLQELSKKQVVRDDDEEEDDEPYVDNRKLNKKLAKFGEQAQKQTQSEIQRAVQQALEQERQKTWMKQNPDFYEVLQHADKFAQLDEELAETILSMPEGFDRQKLVYKNIKALGLHKPPEKQSTIQDKIDANRRGPYYQPTGVGSAPYASAGDFSETGQKNAHAKMKELQARLRIR